MTILFRSFMYAIVGLLLWCAAVHYGVASHVGWKADERPVGMFLATVSMTYSILVGLTLVRTWTRFEALQDAARHNDRVRYDHLLAGRLPPAIKEVIGFFSAAIWFGFWLAEFHSLFIGGVAVTVLAFLLGIVWEILLDLDDPESGVWKIDPPKGMSNAE